MKKRNDNKKEVTKIRLKKTKGSMVNKRTNQRESDLWEEIRFKLKPLNKVYNKFREKRRIAKEKEEQRRLKLEEEQRLREEAALSLQEQEERKLKKEKRLKEEEERRLKTQEKQRLEEKRKKEELEERVRQKRIYKEKLAKGERTRLAQLESAIESRKEEKELAEQTRLKIERSFNNGQRLKEDQLVDYIGNCEGIILGVEKVDKELLSKCKHIQVIAKYGVGLDNIDLEECKRNGIKIGWQGGLNKLSVAEMVLGFMIGLSRNLYQTAIQLKNGTWNKSGGKWVVN